MFDRHQIEQDYSNIDIADEAFEHLFEFLISGVGILTLVYLLQVKTSILTYLVIFLNNTLMIGHKWELIIQKKTLPNT